MTTSKVCLASLLLVCFLGLLSSRVMVLNTTASLPRGIYLKTYATPHKGDIVLVCAEDSPVMRLGRERGLVGYGFCPDRYGYLIKRLAAVEGDTVSIQDEGVTVNGLHLKSSQPQHALPRKTQPPHILRHQALLMSDHPLSFDSRYFGLVSMDSICTPLQPLILWE